MRFVVKAQPAIPQAIHVTSQKLIRISFGCAAAMLKAATVLLIKLSDLAARITKIRSVRHRGLINISTRAQ